jgi:endonuclease/exonuclease/phosphatase (EEP) superfamily protein YafD
MNPVRSILRSPVSLACTAMLGLALMLAFGLAGAWSPWFDAFTHFRAHFAIAAALLAVFLLATRFRLLAVAGLVFAVACFSTVPGALTFFGLGPVQAGFQPKADDQPVYRLLQMNLRFNNATPEKVLSLIGRTQPDIITVEEASQMWRGKLDLLAHAYPHRIYCGGVFGSAILSRRPFAEGTEARCYTTGTLATATVDLGGRTIDVAAIHMGWPWPRQQTWQIASIAEPLQALGETAIMAGDCNAAPWSAAVHRLADHGGLTVMPSVGASWLWRRLPDALRFAGLPIDQVFSKGDVVIHSAQKMPPAGSDHLPILVEFSLRPQVPEPLEDAKTATASVAPAPAGGVRG